MCKKLIYLISFVVLLASTAVQAKLALVENFDNMAAGSPDGRACTGVMGGTWDTHSEGTGNITISDISGSRVANIIGHSAGTVRGIGFNGITNPIDNSETGKVFFRLMIRSYSLVPRTYIGLISDASDDPINSTSADAPTSIPAGFGLLGNGSGGLNLVKTDGTTVLKADVVLGQWYNYWIVANNEKDTFDLYLSEAEGPAGEATLPNPEDLVASGIPFGVATTEPLTGMIFNCPTGTVQAERFYIDEIYWDGDQGLGTPTKARNPSPADQESDVPRDVILSWTPGPFAATHDVYFGTVFDDVTDASRTNPLGVLASQGQTATTYNPDSLLEFSQTYYWRVDEVNAPPDSTIFKGGVWQFTVEPIAYPVAGENITATASSSIATEEGPENTINGSGLDADDLHSAESTAMWLSNVIGPQPTWIQYEFDQVYKLHQMLVWNYNTSIEPVIGFGIKEAAIEYSTDGANWTTLGTHEFTRALGAAGYAPNTTVGLSGVVAKYIKITANSNWGGIVNQYGLSEVRFLYTPVLAREFNPAPGTIDMDVDNVTLSWRAGRDAASHNLYISSDEQTVIDETVSAVNISADRSYVSHDTGALELDQNYYWKVNEVNETATPTIWQGDVLSFSTQQYLVVDDFEDYNDFEPDRIFDTWIDGWGVPANGSQVGYADPPFAEQSIIHGGRQSMPFSYDNTAGAAYSEAERTFATPQDWTKYGIKTLVLYFHGNPTNSVGQLYVKINNSKVVYDGDTAAMTKLRWQQWNIDLASPAFAGLNNITKLSIGIDGNGAKGTLYFDDIRLYRLAPEVVVPSEEVWIEAEAAATITEPMMIYDDPAASGGKYIGTDPSLTNSSNNPPAPAGTASCTFTVAGGVYKLQFRVNIPSGDDSFWVRIPGATTQTTNHSSGWVMFNGIEPGNFWHWDDVFSDDDPGNPIVQFTMPAGNYTLEIAYREAGAMLDVIVVSKID